MFDYQKQISDLNLSQEIVDKLKVSRNDEELKIFALSLPQLKEPDSYIISGRILLYLSIKTSPRRIEDYVSILKNVLNENTKNFMLNNKYNIDQLLEETYDYNFKNYNILSASACLIYLISITKDDPPVETPCQMFLRIAVQLYHNDTFADVKKCYMEMLEQKYVHASPTMFNAGKVKNQMASCFLLTLGDSLDSLLYTGCGDVGKISALQGGIGLSMNAIRNSSISNQGKSSGVLPFGKIFDATIQCVNQGGKRNGAMTITLNDWHIDFVDFIQTRDNFTQNGIRFKQANICAFITNLFMKRVRENKNWTMFCPATAALDGESLLEKNGQDFEDLYEKIEEEAYKRKKEFDLFCQELKVLEKQINSSEVDEEFLENYHKKHFQKIEMRKKLIDFKTVNARDVYNLICDMNVKSGMPYIVYRDPVNYKNNMKNIGSCENLNLCVAPETLVLTDTGHRKISSMKDQEINVWNGKEFSPVVVKQTGENQELIKIEFSDGSELECTPYHKFYIQEKYPESKLSNDILKSSNVKTVEAKDLTTDMKLVKCSFPIIDKGDDLKNAYTSGFFSGDGTYNKTKEEPRKCSYKSIDNKMYCKRHLCYETDQDMTSEFCQAMCYTDRPVLSLYGEKIKIMEKLAYRSKGQLIDNRITLCLDVNILDKFSVPLDKSLKSKLEWFSGYVDADGCIVLNNNNQSLQVSSINKEFLRSVKYMLQTCGCNPKISKITDEKYTLLPDGEGGQKNYVCKPLYRLLLTSFDLQTLINNGLETYRLTINKEQVQRPASHFIKPIKITQIGRYDDTFCFTEHKRNAGIFNGVFTSQCLEIVEPAKPDMISSCNLAHVNLKKFVLQKYDSEEKWYHMYDFEDLGKSCRSLVRNLNKVIDFNYYPLDEKDQDGKVVKRGKISAPNFENRPLGIGVSGLAEVFALLEIPYDSPEAKEINKIIFACIYYNCLEESIRLGKKDGKYTNFKFGESQIFLNGHMQKLKGSPISNGYFQFDLWQQEAEYLKTRDHLNEKIYKMEDNIPVNPSVWGSNGTWEKLREDILVYGIRNSMLVALMPTASSAQLLRNAETTEAHQTLIYSRKLTHGNYTCFSEPFVRDMIKEGFWNQETIDFIMMENGSIQNFHRFFRDNKEFFNPDFYQEDTFKSKMDRIRRLQQIHKGMFEISQKVTMEMCRQRGIYVCQSQSFNIYIPEPNVKKMQSAHNYSNALQLKTGMYYLRQNPASQTDRFTVDLNIKKYHDKMKRYNCDGDVCLMCQ